HVPRLGRRARSSARAGQDGAARSHARRERRPFGWSACGALGRGPRQASGERRNSWDRSIARVCCRGNRRDLAAMIGPDAKTCDRPVIAPLMGGMPSKHPERHRQASPIELLRLGPPQYLVSSKVLSAGVANAPRDRAIARGDKAEILAVPNGGHFDIITPGTKAWGEVEGFILGHGFGEAAHTP